MNYYQLYRASFPTDYSNQFFPLQNRKKKLAKVKHVKSQNLNLFKKPEGWKFIIQYEVRYAKIGYSFLTFVCSYETEM